MRLELVADETTLADAIRNFSSDYYEDFEDVRSIATKYLAATTPDKAVVDELSRRLRCALRVWGAGQRAAAAVKPQSELVKAFSDAQLHARLKQLGGLSLSDMTIEEGRRRVATQGEWTVSSIDQALAAILNELSDCVLLENTNVTYPMKALLLLTGFMPALDSQVRDGLALAGLGGLYATAFSVPLEVDTTAGKKVTRLPFLLGDCLRSFGKTLRAGCEQSGRGKILNSPGRMFDVLLFMQGSQGVRIFELRSTDSVWYAID